MLPRRNRLKINQVNSLRWDGKKQIYTPFFKVVFRFKKEALSPRFGFIVTGRIKSAVKRNKARRLLEEAIRGRIESYPKNIEAIFIVNKEVSETTYEEVSGWIDKIISKVRTSAR
jgi:ribonuclease P protein component